MGKQKYPRLSILGKIPGSVALACSGGADSMAALRFLQMGRRDIEVIHFDHGTVFGSRARKFVENLCRNQKIPCRVVEIKDDCFDSKKSQEANWHDARYAFYKQYHQLTGKKIVSGHHLDDQAEQYLMMAAAGNPRLIPYANTETGVIRPLLLTRKEEIIRWCKANSVEWVEDPSNAQQKYTRNKVRHTVLPAILEVNPGFYKVIAKKVRAGYEEYRKEYLASIGYKS